MFATLTLPEDTLTASSLYRQAESHALRTQPVAGTVHLRMAQDPCVMAQVYTAWDALQTQIQDHFARLVPTTQKGRARGDGPTVYHVHHTLAVARDCYLLALYQHHLQDAALDASQAAAFTLQRLGITQDPQVFHATHTPHPS